MTNGWLSLISALSGSRSLILANSCGFVVEVELQLPRHFLGCHVFVSRRFERVKLFRVERAKRQRGRLANLYIKH